MKKSSSKQKNKHNKNNKNSQAKDQRRQQRKLKLQTKLAEQQALNPDGTTPTTAAERRAALLASHRKTQWKQQVKAGKAATAKVEKRYNRGG